MTEYFVIGDTHSHHEMIKLLLQEQGLLNADENRLHPEVKVVHLGDLINAVEDSYEDDIKSLALVKDGIIDHLILGNHEAPYFGFTAFAGFYPHGEIKNIIYDINVKPCMAIGNLLLSHAGVGKIYGEDLGSAQEAVQRLYDAFLYNRRAPILDGIGWSRGGKEKYGGVLWSDWSEPKCAKFSQLIGHTPSSDQNVRFYTNDFTGEERHTIPSYDILYPASSSNGIKEVTYNIDVGCNLTGFSPSDRIAGVWVTNKYLKFVTLG